MLFQQIGTEQDSYRPRKTLNRIQHVLSFPVIRYLTILVAQGLSKFLVSFSYYWKCFIIHLNLRFPEAKIFCIKDCA